MWSLAFTVALAFVAPERQFARHAPVRSAIVASTAAKPLSSRDTGLALALDDGTRKAHSLAENTQFVTGFFSGISTRESFAALVSSVYFVYEAMEDEFGKSEDANVKALDYPELRRMPALDLDMEFFYGPSWRETVRPTAATRLYVARIREIARSQPLLLVGHQYTRYLGDLFGGQMMGGMARRSLALPDGLGTSFYTFDQIPEAKVFIEGWYSKLNDLPLSPSEKQMIVDEANRVFSLNIALFDELDGSPLRALWALAVRALAEFDAQFARDWEARRGN